MIETIHLLRTKLQNVSLIMEGFKNFNFYSNSRSEESAGSTLYKSVHKKRNSLENTALGWETESIINYTGLKTG